MRPASLPPPKYALDGDGEYWKDKYSDNSPQTFGLTTIIRTRPVSGREKMYLSWQTSEKTWRQFYEELHGPCHWMETTQYGGHWLDKKLNEPI